MQRAFRYPPEPTRRHSPLRLRSTMRQVRRGPKRLPMRCRRRKLQPGIPNTRSAGHSTRAPMGVERTWRGGEPRSVDDPLAAMGQSLCYTLQSLLEPIRGVRRSRPRISPSVLAIRAMAERVALVPHVLRCGLLGWSDWQEVCTSGQLRNSLPFTTIGETPGNPV